MGHIHKILYYIGKYSKIWNLKHFWFQKLNILGSDKHFFLLLNSGPFGSILAFGFYKHVAIYMHKYLYEIYNSTLENTLYIC